MEDDRIENGSQPEKSENGAVKNPLLISVVIELIIKHLPFHDMKTSRLISKLWNETVTRSRQFQLNTKNFVVFGNGSNDYYSKTIYFLGAMDRLGDCLRSPLRMVNFPLHTFIIVISRDWKDSNLKESTLINFLNAISPIAQKILIQHDREFVPVGDNEVADLMVFPKLKYLKLKLCEVQTGFIWKFLGHLMRPGNTPQLEKLHIRWKNLDISGSSVSQLISTINVPATTLKLKSLKMKCPLQLQHLREFRLLQLNLREFHIEVEDISKYEETAIVRSILERQSKTLTRLKIIDLQERYQRVETRADIFPILPNLETLIIYTEKISFRTMRLREQFPRLKCLIFTGVSSPWRQFFGTEIETTLSINEVGVTRRFPDERFLYKAIQYFPNIRKLQIPAVAKMTNVVFDKMSHLEELTLDTTDIRCIDDIITGMTLKECEDYLGRMTDWRKNIEVMATLRDVRLTTMPISCLTKLKTLRLYSMDDGKKVEITKLSYLMVLLNMDTLQCIDVGKRYFPPNYQVQPSVWKRVCGKFEIHYTPRNQVVEYRK